MAKKLTGISLVSGDKNSLKIQTIENVTLGELADGYIDNSNKIEGGVSGWSGKLDIRPKFQRSYIVDGNIDWQIALVNSVLNDRPIGVMYFGKKPDGNYINIDGQQRLMTLLSFITNGLTLKMNINGNVTDVNFWDIPEEWQNKIKSYTPYIKECVGDESSMLEWFSTINTPNCTLTEQELRNAAYNGVFVECIKSHFAKVRSNCSTTSMNCMFLNDDSTYCYKKYSKGIAPERQELVELVLDWVSYRDFGSNKKMNTNDRIESYMHVHRNDTNASDAVNYYKSVIDWVNDIFFHNGSVPSSYQTIQIQNWNVLYEKYKDKTNSFTSDDKKHITERCNFYINQGQALWVDAKGIYEWVLRGEQDSEAATYLNLRSFKKEDKAKMYKMQGGIDPIDGKPYPIEDMRAHHIKSFRSGGLSILDNMIMVCEESHKKIHADSMYTNQMVKEKRDNLLKINGHTLI